MYSDVANLQSVYCDVTASRGFPLPSGRYKKARFSRQRVWYHSMLSLTSGHAWSPPGLDGIPMPTRMGFEPRRTKPPMLKVSKSLKDSSKSCPNRHRSLFTTSEVYASFGSRAAPILVLSRQPHASWRDGWLTCALDKNISKDLAEMACKHH